MGSVERTYGWLGQRTKSECGICFNFKWRTAPKTGPSRDSLMLTDLLQSAKNGCRTCRILEQVVRAFYPVVSPAATMFEFTVFENVPQETASEASYNWAESSTAPMPGST